MIRTLLCYGTLCLLAATYDALASPHLNQWTAMQIGLDALKAKYPNQYRDLILRYRPFVAKYGDGIWHVYGKTPIPGMTGGVPTIDVRDADEKILKIYFQK